MHFQETDQPAELESSMHPPSASSPDETMEELGGEKIDIDKEGANEKQAQSTTTGSNTPTNDEAAPFDGHNDVDNEHPFGWVVVAAAFFVQAIVIGTVNGYGVYQVSQLSVLPGRERLLLLLMS